jgi:hypothetical protein
VSRTSQGAPAFPAALLAAGALALVSHPTPAVAQDASFTRDHWLNLPGERQFIVMEDLDAVREAVHYPLSMGTDAVKVWYLCVGDPRDQARQREYLEVAGRWARDAGVPLIVHTTLLEGARVMGKAELLGTVEPGRLADLLAVREDPLQDIRGLRSVVKVVKRGVAHDREELAFEHPP